VVFSDVLIVGGVAAFVALFVGVLAGSLATARRMRRQVEEIGEEMAALTKVAEQKLLDDDPNLPELTQNLNDAVERAYRAIDALENQSALNRQKTEGAKEIAAASRRIMTMMEDMGAEVPHVKAPKIESVAETVETTAPPRLR